MSFSHHVIKTSLLLFLAFLISAAEVLAETNIANGKLFVCIATSIYSVKTDAEVSASKARKRFTRIINKQNSIIASSSSGSSRYKKAVKKRRNARKGRRHVKACANGTLDGQAAFVGDWNLVTENGMTPAENGYNSLTMSFAAKSFTSDFDGNSFDCHWEGSYSYDSEAGTAPISTEVGTGGASCSNAVGQTRTAAVTFSNNNNTLTLDYTPGGTLQVYQRVS